MAKAKAMEKADPLRWWREARFGMFIHWGLYAVPAGYYKGKECPGIGEWIMYRFQIPAAEYEEYALRFDPVMFNADAWVRLAKAAGMKYIVITSKHHDGFAMFDSPSSDYDIVDRTPYGRDPMAALAKACRKHGLKLCFYYSQYQDWHHPSGGRNFWDYDEDRKDFEQYLSEKCIPQLRELLTQYGPIGLIWFDTPGAMTLAQSMRCKRFVHRLQPKCLVSGRVGNDVGDYGSMGDNQIPAGRLAGDWETPATMNDTWGFKVQDHNWKSVKTLLHLLCDLASKGVNYLLNVGPTAEGLIPKPSVERLKRIGKWMKVNSEAIYATQANPYPYEFDWGRITRKPGRLYLLVYKWRRRLTLGG
ncbi:MAG: alpha-L-fucosidase, partial [Phycisphaerae bacterium]